MCGRLNIGITRQFILITFNNKCQNIHTLSFILAKIAAEMHVMHSQFVTSLQANRMQKRNGRLNRIINKKSCYSTHLLDQNEKHYFESSQAHFVR